MNKLILSSIITLLLSNVSYANEVNWTLNTWISTSELEFSLPCNPVSVSNWTVNPNTCIITCNSWYNLSWVSCNKTYSSWWGWWGWGSSAPICWDHTLYEWAKRDITTCDNIILKKIISWIIPVWIKLTDSWGKYIFEINKDEEIKSWEWNIFTWKLISPKRLLNTKTPTHDKKIVALRALKIWAYDSTVLYFKKWATLTFSYSWISSSVKPEDIRIYSYDEELWKYFLQDLNRVIDKNKKIISVDLFMTHNIFILTNWLLEWDDKWSEDIIFKDFFRDSWWHWSREYIEKLYNTWSIDKNERFYPDTKINRAEFVKMIMETFWLWSTESVKSSFYDIPSGIWYEKYIVKAETLWIIEWYPNWSFWPSRYINRAEAVKIVLRAAKVSVENTWKKSFTDVESDKWYAKYIEKAKSIWIIHWYLDWSFWPADKLTRWQIAKIVFRMFEVK